MAIPSEVPMRKCKKCGEDKPSTEEFFYNCKSNKTQKVYLMGTCKDCLTGRTMDRYYNDGLREKVLGRQAMIKNAVFEAYGGYICACCGETERLVLQIDHMNNDGGTFRRNVINKGDKDKHGGAGIHTYTWLYKNGFPPGHQVLCAGCNVGKSRNKGICPLHPRRKTSNDQRLALVGASAPKRNVTLSGVNDMVFSADESRSSSFKLLENWY